MKIVNKICGGISCVNKSFGFLFCFFDKRNEVKTYNGDGNKYLIFMVIIITQNKNKTKKR
jgi:hypothetical protein